MAARKGSFAKASKPVPGRLQPTPRGVDPKKPSTLKSDRVKLSAMVPRWLVRIISVSQGVNSVVGSDSASAAEKSRSASGVPLS